MFLVVDAKERVLARKRTREAAHRVARNARNAGRSVVVREVLSTEVRDTLAGGEFGGKGPFVLPPHHVAGMVVPRGGSSCANCKFARMRDDGPHCDNIYWIEWNGGNSRLPVDDPRRYCSDWWEHA